MRREFSQVAASERSVSPRASDAQATVLSLVLAAAMTRRDGLRSSRFPAPVGCPIVRGSGPLSTTDVAPTASSSLR